MPAEKARSLPASAVSNGSARIGSISISCIGAGAFPSAKRWRRSSVCARPGRSCAGRVEFRHRGHARALRAGRRASLRDQSGSLSPGRARYRMELLPWLRERRIPLMAYSPLGQGALLPSRKLMALARDSERRQRNWRCAVVRSPDVIGIPSRRISSTSARIARPCAVAHPTALAAIDAAFPPPTRSTPLAVI